MKKVAEHSMERSKRLEVIAHVLGRDKEAMVDTMLSVLDNMAADIELMQHFLELEKGEK